MRSLPPLAQLRAFEAAARHHAIDAVIAGQGIAICDDLLVADDLRSGRLVKALDAELPGAGYYLLYRTDHPNKAIIEDFFTWAKSAR